MTVQMISERSHVDLDIVKMVVQHLVYFGIVKLTDLFLFSNVYCARSKLAKLVQSRSRQKKFIDHLLRTVKFDKPDTMRPILENLPPIKLPSFITALTACDR